MQIEEQFQQIEEIVQRMEKGEQSLEDAFADYKKGLTLCKDCSDQLAKVEQEIQILNDSF